MKIINSRGAKISEEVVVAVVPLNSKVGTRCSVSASKGGECLNGRMNKARKAATEYRPALLLPVCLLLLLLLLLLLPLTMAVLMMVVLVLLPSKQELQEEKAMVAEALGDDAFSPSPGSSSSLPPPPPACANSAANVGGSNGTQPISSL